MNKCKNNSVFIILVIFVYFNSMRQNGFYLLNCTTKILLSNEISDQGYLSCQCTFKLNVCREKVTDVMCYICPPGNKEI